ncbi:hypothetical protein [Candidatus Kuenenia sp.]|uniref:hypothetical protein n=1 Tax=Candidatus Kuenenia sp. TaxID=2499824 RepID=UPI0032207525
MPNAKLHGQGFCKIFPNHKITGRENQFLGQITRARQPLFPNKNVVLRDIVEKICALEKDISKKTLCLCPNGKRPPIASQLSELLKCFFCQKVPKPINFGKIGYNLRKGIAIARWEMA